LKAHELDTIRYTAEMISALMYAKIDFS